MNIQSTMRSALGGENIESPLDHLARFVSGHSSVPDSVRNAARRGLIDLLGVTVAGGADESMAPLIDYARATYRNGVSTAVAMDEPMAPEAAALINAAAGHVLDFDDCYDPFGGHPSVVVLPPLLALGEALDMPAQRILDAYAIGVEVTGVLGKTLNMTHYERGWHPTATVGILGAAAGAARLLGLEAEGVKRALGVAGAFAAGTKASFGTFLKPAQVGFAAARGLAAANLARLGMDAPAFPVHGRHSFDTIFNGKAADWTPLAQLGSHWGMLDPGLSFKLYPCCGSTHASIDAVRKIAGGRSLAAAARIDIFVHPRRRPHTDRPHPTSSTEAKFSLQYVVATAALTGNVALSDFEEAALRDPQRRSLLERIHVHDLAQDRWTLLPGRDDCFVAEVRATMSDGSLASGAMLAPRGWDAREPLTDEELETKFVDTIASMSERDAARKLLSLIGAWSSGVGGLRELMAEARALVCAERRRHARHS
ncbi:MAG TPA: MmgE/PrpD family protein [Rhodoblastus sp.]|nr:MmgE/PrpD family protein [Rhodoblastus sp.]